MLIRRRDLEGIRDGEITLAYRRWKRPTVRAGGTLKTVLGELEIAAVGEVSPRSITAVDARRAGFATRRELLELLDRGEGIVHRIEFGALGADPRIALRATVARGEDLEELLTRTGRLDARAPDGPWTRDYLELIAERPAVRAGDICEEVGAERAVFKRNVRKLKNLGLTESLDVGYRLSPRGKGLLRNLRRRAGGRRG